MYTCLWTEDPYRLNAPPALIAASMAARIRLASGPPPMASKTRVALLALSASVRSPENVSDVESHTHVAPAARRSSA